MSRNLVIIFGVVYFRRQIKIRRVLNSKIEIKLCRENYKVIM